MNYTDVQNIAKQTMTFIRNSIRPGMSLTEIRTLCESRMLELGADSFWYWDIGAFVFAGEETTRSVSGKEYITSGRLIASNDIITIDLSPQAGNIWGDYARTIILENGSVSDISQITNPEWKQGLMMEEYLHEEMRRFVTPDTTFESLFYHINSLIQEKGFVNLDFAGNLGHSIVRNKNDRVYIEKGNHIPLGEVFAFTFEPHIRTLDGAYGYKQEDIYFFENGTVKAL